MTASQNHQIKGLTLYQFDRFRASGSFDNSVPVHGEQQFPEPLPTMKPTGKQTLPDLASATSEAQQGNP